MARTFLTAAAWICFLPAAGGQTPDTATLSGRVFDATHAMIPGAEVVATNLQTGLERHASSDGQGRFSFVGLPVGGAYRISAAKAGFASAAASSVSLAGGSSAEISLQLQVAGGKSVVTVEGAAGDVRIDQPQLGVHLDAEQIERDAAAQQAHHLSRRC